LRIVFEPAARQDLLDATEWYLHEAGARQAARFEVDVRDCLDLLVRLPALGAPSHHNLRKLPLRRFPYSIGHRG